MEDSSESQETAPSRNPWSWIPTLYFTQAIPYAMVSFVSRVFYKNMEVSNTEIAFYVGLLGWPWVIKPLWSPLVDVLRTKRWWILTTQFSLALGFAGIALIVQRSDFFFWSLAIFSIVALASATHDIAADGFYMLASSSHEQAKFVGIRSTFWRAGWIFCEGALVVYAGYRARVAGDYSTAWSMTFAIAALCFLAMLIYHSFILPRPTRDVPQKDHGAGMIMREFGETFSSFFQKKNIFIILAFILFYRFSEAQLVALKSPFLLDAREVGGLGLSTEQIGWLNGVVGIALLLTGGVLSGLAAAKHGLKAWLWWMVVAINAPNLAYIYLSVVQPEDFRWICVAVAFEQFGYGFGFGGYMLYLLYVARGNHETAHYAICTGFMALGIIVPGLWAGALQASVGYQNFFIWVMLATIPSFLVCWLIPLDAEFGRKTDVPDPTETAT